MVALWTAVLSAGACVLFVLAATILRSRSGGSAREMSLPVFAMAVWAGGAALTLNASDPVAHQLAVAIAHTGVVATSPGVLLGVVAFLSGAGIRGPLLAAVLAIPAATLSLVWTNPAHGLMWDPAIHTDPERTLRLSYGPWFWRVHVPAAYAMCAFATFRVLRELRERVPSVSRHHLRFLLAGLLVPLLVNVASTFGLTPPNVPSSPLANIAAGILFSWGFFRRGLFRLVPIAHRAVFEQIRDGVLVADLAGRVRLTNSAAAALTGRGQVGLLGVDVAEVLPEGPEVRRLLASEGPADAVGAARSGDRHLDVSVSPIRDAQGEIGGRVFLLRDVSDRERALASLRDNEALVRGIVEHSPNGVLRLRPRRSPEGDVRDFDCTFANPAAAALLGRPIAELTGRPLKGALHPHTAGLFQEFREALTAGARCELERQLTRGGRELWLRFIAVPAVTDLIVTCIDVTDTKRREVAMQAAASEDPLTGLLNRRGLEADGPSLLRDAAGELRHCALLYFDLDRFKQVNDALGHEAGDIVLCEFSHRLQRCTRGPDLLARVGGDEFVLLLPDTSADGARWVAQRVLELSREPIRIGGSAFDCTPSIGIALQPEHGRELKALLQTADRAMYAAKTSRCGFAIAQTGEPPLAG